MPDPSLVDAYESGFITTQITRSGNDLNTGVNGYESEFSHDVVGHPHHPLHPGLLHRRPRAPHRGPHRGRAPGQYVDGLWTYSVPWAVYLLKTGDTAFVRAELRRREASRRRREPSIEAAAHAIAADRTGPMGTMEATDDIDTQGYWTTDDFEALLGLAAYRYLASALGEHLGGVLGVRAVRQPSRRDQRRSRPRPSARATSTTSPAPWCSRTRANRCNNPKDANWTSPSIGNWAWEASLFGAPVDGPGLTMIDATYDYGFGRLHGLLPPDTTGGFPGDYYSSAYNAAHGRWPVWPARTTGIRASSNFEFMLANTQSGPLSWWESSSAPDPTSPWVGRHPVDGPGLVAPRLGDGRRGQGAPRLARGATVRRLSRGRVAASRPAGSIAARPISVTNFPTTAGHRVTVTITSVGRSVSLSLRGTPRPGPCCSNCRPSAATSRCVVRDGRPGHRNGHPGAARSSRHRHPAARTVARSRTLRPWSEAMHSGSMVGVGPEAGGDVAEHGWGRRVQSSQWAFRPRKLCGTEAFPS